MKWQLIIPDKEMYRLKIVGSAGVVIAARNGTSTVEINLAKEGANALILGVVNLSGNDQLNLQVTTVHQQPNTHAETMIFGVVDGQAQARVDGLIKINQGAQRVTDFLTERILLLTSTARAIAQPKLEIEADEVRASHAAAVSSLDPEELFYLMSRGVDAEAAESLIVSGFLNYVINRIDDDKMRAKVKDYVGR